jgi:hypothetical protein
VSKLVAIKWFSPIFSDTNIFFWVNVLALKFLPYVIYIKRFLFQKFHGKKKQNQTLGGCQSWQQ